MGTTMQAGEEPDDYISRAKAKLATWNAMRDEAYKASRFDHCTASELIAIVETRKDLAGLIQYLAVTDANILVVF